MFEHRLVLEQKLGRPLLASERVDHIDGLTLHNSPDNLRLFQDNAQHLRETLAGKTPRWSEAGYQNMLLRHRPGASLGRVDTHRQRIASGAVRLRQILLLALRLGIDSPYLSGTHRHTTKAGIDMSSRPTIERALADLCAQWGWAHPL
ncbi:MAG: HNH endonuclease [Schleiferiaceae bacterium]